MDPKEKSELPGEPDETPGFSKVDWDEIETGSGTGSRSGPSGELPGEEDDNPFQDSDEALPNETEERALRRNPSKEGGRFDEI